MNSTHIHLFIQNRALLLSLEKEKQRSAELHSLLKSSPSAPQQPQAPQDPDVSCICMCVSEQVSVYEGVMLHTA